MAFDYPSARIALIRISDEPKALHRMIVTDDVAPERVSLRLAPAAPWTSGTITRRSFEDVESVVTLDEPHPPLYGRASARLRSVLLVNRPGDPLRSLIVDAPSGLDAGAAVSVWSDKIRRWIPGTLEGVDAAHVLRIRIRSTR